MTIWENFTEQQALDCFEEHLLRMHNCTSTAGKKNNGEVCLQLLLTFYNLPWRYDDNRRSWDDRFIKTVKVNPQKMDEVPNTSGVYLVGSTYFNPITDEKFYWIKVGKSTQLNNRMKQYATHNPMLWKNSFWALSKDKISRAESVCHEVLKSISVEIANNTDEWFRVSREDYLIICEKGFDYFESALKNYRALGLL